MHHLLYCLLILSPYPDELLTITIDSEEKSDIIEYDKPFQVILTNTSDKPIHLWKHKVRNGYFQLTFQFINARTGEKHLVNKREIDGEEYWKLIKNGDDRESDTVTIASKEMNVIEVTFSGFTWGHSMWKGLPSPNINDRYRLSVTFESKASPDAVKHSVWTGNISSKELSIKFVATKLKTPHRYLWNGYPDRAIEMMKADPTWINRTDPEDQCTPLHHAARFGHVKAVQWLLNNGADINARAYNDYTPLHLTDDPKVVELILEKKPNFTLGGVSGTAFHRKLDELSSARNEAEKTKRRKIVDLYLKAGAEYDLATAIHLNDLNQVKKILAKSPQLADNFQDTSPLRRAASQGHLEICQYLIEKYQVDVNDFERGIGYPIIKEALKYPKVVKLLIDHNVDLKTRITWGGFRSGIWIIGNNATALHYAADHGVPETVKLLLDAGVDLFAITNRTRDKGNGSGQTALDIAAILDRAENMEAMLTHPQFKTAKPEVRQLLLDRCLVSYSYGDEANRLKLIQLLVNHGANPIAMVNNRTGIQVAVESIHPPSNREENAELKKIIVFFREKGANLNLFGAVAIEDEVEVNRLLKLNPKCASDRRSDGYSALHMAVALNNKNIVSALLKAGCDVNIRNHSDNMAGLDETPLHEAAFWGQLELARLLIEAGADVNAVSTNKNDPTIKSTPLSEAKRLSNSKVARLLIEKGAKE